MCQSLDQIRSFSENPAYIYVPIYIIYLLHIGIVLGARSVDIIGDLIDFIYGPQQPCIIYDPA